MQKPRKAKKKKQTTEIARGGYFWEHMHKLVKFNERFVNLTVLKPLPKEMLWLK